MAAEPSSQDQSIDLHKDFTNQTDQLRALTKVIKEAGIGKRGGLTVRIVVLVILLFVTNIVASGAVAYCFNDLKHHAACEILPGYSTTEHPMFYREGK